MRACSFSVADSRPAGSPASPRGCRAGPNRIDRYWSSLSAAWCPDVLVVCSLLDRSCRRSARSTTWSRSPAPTAACTAGAGGLAARLLQPDALMLHMSALTVWVSRIQMQPRTWMLDPAWEPPPPSSSPTQAPAAVLGLLPSLPLPLLTLYAPPCPRAAPALCARRLAC